jgi:transcriptional regulator with XRE-family HTH domain
MNSSISDCRVSITTNDRCDLSPRQGDLSQYESVIWRRLSRSGRMCDIASMSEEEVSDINAIRAALRREMERRGIKAKRLAKAAGLGETAVRDILEKVDDPRVGTLIKIADALDIPASSLFGSQVPVLGKIGAGGCILFEEADEPELVDRPPGAGGKLMALKVAGDSMMPVYRDGDIIYVHRDHEGVRPEYLGEECAVHTDRRRHVPEDPCARLGAESLHAALVQRRRYVGR